MNGTSGRTSGRQFAYYDRDTSSWRMWPDTGLWGSIEFSETWPKTGCMSGGRAYEHPTLVPRITGSDCSSSPHLPTVRAANGEGRNNTVWYRPDGKPQNLENAIARVPSVAAMLPTPIASDGDRERNNPSQAKRKSPPLSAVGHLLPTPKASDYKRGDSEAEAVRNSPGLVAVTAHFPTPTASDGTGGGQHPSKRVGRTKQLIDTVLSIGVPTPPLFDVGSD